MASGSNSIGTILASIFITLILAGAGMYFGLPLLFPNMNADLSSFAKTDDISDDGLLVKTQYYQSDSMDYISDGDNVSEKIADTEMNFTTQGNTKLAVSFQGIFLLHMDSNFAGGTRYNITLSVEGVQNRTTRISYFEGISSGTTVQECYGVNLFFETGVLAAGTYTITMYWKSITDVTSGYSDLYTGGGSAHYPRSLYVQELKA